MPFIRASRMLAYYLYFKNKSLQLQSAFKTRLIFKNLKKLFLPGLGLIKEREILNLPILETYAFQSIKGTRFSISIPVRLLNFLIGICRKTSSHLR